MLPVVKVGLSCIHDIVGIYKVCKDIGLVRSATQELRVDNSICSVDIGDYYGSVSSSESDGAFKISVFKISTRKRLLFSGMSYHSSVNAWAPTYRLRFPDILINPFTSHDEDEPRTRKSHVYSSYIRNLENIVVPDDLSEEVHFQYSLMDDIPELDDIMNGHNICSALDVLREHVWIQVEKGASFIDEDYTAIEQIVRELHESILRVRT